MFSAGCQFDVEYIAASTEALDDTTAEQVLEKKPDITAADKVVVECKMVARASEELQAKKRMKSWKVPAGLRAGTDVSILHHEFPFEYVCGSVIVRERGSDSIVSMVFYLRVQVSPAQVVGATYYGVQCHLGNVEENRNYAFWCNTRCICSAMGALGKRGWILSLLLCMYV